MTDPHESVVSSASQGDAVAIDVLIERHLPGLEAYVKLNARLVVHAREEHGDIVQSVCREVLENMDRFEYRGEAQFRQWLFTKAKSKLVDRLRYWQADKRDVNRDAAPCRDIQHARTEADQTRYEGLKASLPTPSQYAIAREGGDLLERAFAQLSQEHREVINLSRIFGYSNREVAERLSKTEPAARQLLRRALVRLGHLMAQMSSPEETAG
jgi:RNA polymerase sigma factor (sigma-70 family)